MSDLIKKLLNVELPDPETLGVTIPRLGATFVLQELSYDKVLKLRNEPQDSTIYYLLSAIKDPDLHDKRWYEGRMGCVSPVDAVKKLFRAGEIERLAKAADLLNGYGPGSIQLLSDEELMQAVTVQAVEELQKNGTGALT